MIYSCIDFGSDNIKIVVGRVTGDGVNVLGTVSTQSVGIKIDCFCNYIFFV